MAERNERLIEAADMAIDQWRKTRDDAWKEGEAEAAIRTFIGAVVRMSEDENRRIGNLMESLGAIYHPGKEQVQ